MPLCQTQKRLPLPALEQQCHGRIEETPALVLPEEGTTPGGHSGQGSSQLCTLVAK